MSQLTGKERRLINGIELEGCELITPPPESPYYTCDGCTHYRTDLVCSGGYRDKKRFNTFCTYGETLSPINVTVYGTRIGRAETPITCPFLNEKGLRKYPK